jgi:hypothetical protein
MACRMAMETAENRYVKRERDVLLFVRAALKVSDGEVPEVGVAVESYECMQCMQSTTAHLSGTFFEER